MCHQVFFLKFSLREGICQGISWTGSQALASGFERLEGASPGTFKKSHFHLTSVDSTHGVRNSRLL
jgi:hypothetical protein